MTSEQMQDERKVDTENPAALVEMLREGLDLQQSVTIKMREITQYLAGNDYRSGFGAPATVYHNHNYEFTANVKPHLVHYNPRFYLDCGLPGIGEEQVDALEQGINQWTQDIQLVRVLRDCADDFLAGFAVAAVDVEEIPGTEDQEMRPIRPSVWRVPPSMFVDDPRAVNRLFPRWRAHLWIAPASWLKLQKEKDGTAKYNAKLLDSAVQDQGYRQVMQKLGREGRHRFAGSLSGDEVVVLEMWNRVRKTVCSFLYCGDAAVATSDFLREPYPYSGPRCGPYVRWGAFTIADQVYEAGPLMFTQGKNREINRHRRQTAEDAEAAKRIVAFDSLQPGVGAKIVTTKNNSVIGIPNLANVVKEIALGGVQPHQTEYLDRLMAEQYQTSGLNDVIRGNISGQATAREISEAQGAFDVRTKYLRSMFHDGVCMLAHKALHYLNESELCQFHVAAVDQRTGERVAKIFIGGQGGPQPHLPTEMLRPQIAPYSMEMVSDHILQKRMQDLIIGLTNIIPAGIQNPGIRLRNLLDDWCETFNIRNAGDRYIDFKAIMAMQRMTAIQAVSGVMGGLMGAGGEVPGEPGATTIPAGEAEAGGDGDPVFEQAAMQAAARRAA